MTLEAYEKWLVTEQWQGYNLEHLLADSSIEHSALRSLAIITNGLAGETGETIEHFKKLIRDGVIDRPVVAMELGDVLAYLTWLTASLGYNLEDVAGMNRAKLLARGTKR